MHFDVISYHSNRGIFRWGHGPPPQELKFCLEYRTKLEKKSVNDDVLKKKQGLATLE